MPVISRFFGIIILMYWRDHTPPHFHAKYGDDETIVEIESGAITGRMPTRAMSMVREWRELHKDELMESWTLAKHKRALKRIAPLE